MLISTHSDRRLRKKRFKKCEKLSQPKLFFSTQNVLLCFPHEHANTSWFFAIFQNLTIIETIIAAIETC